MPPSPTSIRPRPRAHLISPRLAWALVIAWAAVIFVLSSIPDLDPSGSGRLRFGLSKVGHVVVFSVLGLLLRVALDSSATRGRRTWWAIVIATTYGIVDEIHQSFVPGRTPLLFDVVIDGVSAAGGAIGWRSVGRPLIAWWIRRRRRHRRGTATRRGSAVHPDP